MPLLLLLRLQNVQLPVQVTDPQEVRYVSVLLATGLIEAEFSTLKTRVPHAIQQVATVVRITEDGFAEIAMARGVRSCFAMNAFRFRSGLRLL